MNLNFIQDDFDGPTNALKLLIDIIFIKLDFSSILEKQLSC